MTPLEVAEKCAEIMWKNDNASRELGFILEKINFENSLMSSNKENKNSSENNKDKNFKKDATTILDDEEHYKDDNLNYLININA